MPRLRDLEIEITSSYHPASAGRTAGQYKLSYRIDGRRDARFGRSQDRLGVVNLGATVGEWNSIVLRPAADFAVLFPDLDSRDFSLFTLTLNAVSTGSMASGYFDYLRFSRQSTGQVALRVQDDLAASYAGRYPTVTQRLGLELSHALPHLNWFGGSLSLPDYTGVSRAAYSDFLAQTAVPAIHAAGGLASYNHPYGTSSGPALPLATQDDLLSQQVATMLGNDAVGADILEVGYVLRAGVDLAHHVALWDACSRNALFLTGNGVSDDHKGVNWVTRGLEWTTSAWAPDTLETSLLDALRAGRAWCGSLTGYTGGLDLLVDGECPMGSVSVSALAQRDLVATATGMPGNGSLRIVQGAVDYAGPGMSAPEPRYSPRFPPAGSPAARSTCRWTPTPPRSCERRCWTPPATSWRCPTRCGCCGRHRRRASRRLEPASRGAVAGSAQRAVPPCRAAIRATTSGRRSGGSVAGG